MAVLIKSAAPLLGIWKIEESPEELLSLLDAKQDYRSVLEKIHTGARQQEWLASRVLLKELLGKEVRIAYHPNGAPYLPDEKLHISISHTKGYAAVLLQEHPAAGIDIEHRSNRILKIRSRFMNPEEEAALNKEHETEHLLIHWCAKEALYKMIGQVEVDFCKHLHICPFEFAPQGEFTAYETRTIKCTKYKLGYRIYADFVLVWSRDARLCVSINS